MKMTSLRALLVYWKVPPWINCGGNWVHTAKVLSPRIVWPQYLLFSWRTTKSTFSRQERQLCVNDEETIEHGRHDSYVPFWYNSSQFLTILNNTFIVLDKYNQGPRVVSPPLSVNLEFRAEMMDVTCTADVGTSPDFRLHPMPFFIALSGYVIYLKSQSSHFIRILREQNLQVKVSSQIKVVLKLPLFKCQAIKWSRKRLLWLNNSKVTTDEDKRLKRKIVWQTFHLRTSIVSYAI